MAVASWFFIVGGIDIPAKENPPLHAGEFSRTGPPSRIRECRSLRSRFGRVRFLVFGLRLGTLGPLVQDAVADGFGRVVFTVFDLTCLISSAGLGGEGQRFGNLLGPDLGVVGMEGGVEPEEAPPGEEEAILGQAL